MPKRANHSRDDLRILAALSDIGVALGGSQDLRSALERMLEKLKVGRGIVRGAVFLLHEDTGRSRSRRRWGSPARGCAPATGPARASSAGWSRAVGR
jgi:hypothetical protein